MRTLAIALVGMFVGCGGGDGDGSNPLSCGSGTHEENGSCVPDGILPDGGGGTADAPGIPSNGKRVFVTRTTYRGDLGQLSGADTKCNGAAASANLPGSYTAWLSDFDNDAITRITAGGPWYTLDGTMVFANHAALTASPLSAIDIQEDGDQLDFGERVWTGTSAGGNSDGGGGSEFCYTWTSMSGTATVGSPKSTDGGWTSSETNLACTAQAHLYCFQQ